MSQLRKRIWQYFREHHRMPSRTPEFDTLLQMATRDEELVIAMDLCAMRIVSFLRNEGKDLTPEQQVQAITPLIQETASLIVLHQIPGWHPIG